MVNTPRLSSLQKLVDKRSEFAGSANTVDAVVEAVNIGRRFDKRFIMALTLLIAVVGSLIVAGSFWMVSNQIEDEKARCAERDNEAV
jgi:hypothetical protein